MNQLGTAVFDKLVFERDVLPLIEKRRGHGSLFPVWLELNLGLSCQLSCVFCFRWESGRYTNNDDTGLYRRSSQSPLSKKEVFEILKEFKQCGGIYLAISGGLEPFTSPITVPAIQYAITLGLRVSIYSNGVSNSFENNAIQSILLNTESIRFSLHAATAKIFQKMQMPGSSDDESERVFNSVKHHITILAKRAYQENAGVKINQVFLVTRDNIHELEDAIWGAKNMGITQFHVSEEMTGRQSWLEGEREQLESILKRIARSDLSPMVVCGDRHHNLQQPQSPSHCYVAYHKVSLDPFGRLFPCCLFKQIPFQKKAPLQGTYPIERLSAILTRWRERMPISHCKVCPLDWERSFNRGVHKALGEQNKSDIFL